MMFVGEHTFGHIVRLIYCLYEVVIILMFIYSWPLGEGSFVSQRGSFSGSLGNEDQALIWFTKN